MREMYDLIYNLKQITNNLAGVVEYIEWNHINRINNTGDSEHVNKALSSAKYGDLVVVRDMDKNVIRRGIISGYGTNKSTSLSLHESQSAEFTFVVIKDIITKEETCFILNEDYTLDIIPI